VSPWAQLSRPTRAYIVAVCAVACAAVAGALAALPTLSPTPPPAMLVLFAVLLYFGDQATIRLTSDHGHNAAAVAGVAACILLPAPVPPLLGVVVLALANLPQRRDLYKRLYNIAHDVLILACTATVAHLLSPDGTLLPRGDAGLFVAAPPLTLVLGVYYAVDAGLNVGVHVLHQQRTPWQVWREDFRASALIDLGAEATGVLTVVAWQFGHSYVAIPVLIAGALVLSYHIIARIEREKEAYARASLATVRAMARAVDAKDSYTKGHSDRVAAYAVAVGAALGLAPDDLERLHLAGTLHDVGKIAVPDAILGKAGPLDADERAIIQEHPAKGEEILGDLPSLQAILPAVRGHHESWDGTGYPDGLAGTAIHPDAALLAVCDAFDAMTSTRTYRVARSSAQARDVLRQGRGRQFAPHVVDAFERAVMDGTLLLPDRCPAAQMSAATARVDTDEDATSARRA